MNFIICFDYSLILLQDNKVFFFRETFPQEYMETLPIIVPGEFNHVAVSYTGESTSIFVNGLLVCTLRLYFFYYLIKIKTGCKNTDLPLCNNNY